MTNFSGKNQTLTFNGVSTGCITGISYSDTADSFKTACAAAAAKGTVTGLRDITATINWLLSTDDVTLLNSIKPGDNATDWSHDPNGANSGDIRITSNSAKVEIVSRNMDYPVAGLCTVTATANFDDMLIAAQA